MVHLVEQTLGSRQPAAAASHLAPQQKSLGEQARAPRGSHHIPQPEALVMCPEPGVVTVGICADQVRRHCQPLQILQSERPLLIRSRQLREGIPPHVSPEELPAAIRQIGHGHSLPQPNCWVANVCDQQPTSPAVDVTRSARIHPSLPAANAVRR